MGYIATKGRYGSLGAIAPGDFGAVYSAQRNEARRLFGETSFRLPGRTDINYPNLSGTYARKIIDYWRKDSKKVYDNSYRYGADVFGGLAVYNQWKRSVDALNSFLVGVIRTSALTVGDGLIAQESAKRVWDILDGVVLPMKGVQEAPTDWELVKESVIESVRDLATSSGVAKLLKLAVFGGLAYFGYSAYLKSKRGAQ